MGYGDGDYNSSTAILNTVNPLRRDTLTIPAGGWSVIRFMATPGLWMFHCHIIWHVEAGLAMQFRLLPDVIASYNIPADVKALCSGPP
jgi:Multicopper oxidase